jgi:hypothetical protein
MLDTPNKTQTVVRFNGHITWEGRAGGLPETIHAFLILENADEKFISEMVEAQSRAFIGSQAMYVQRDQGAIVDLRVMPRNRMLVPFHNIAYIDVDVIPMTGELSAPDELGVERLSNGEEPTKQ